MATAPLFRGALGLNNVVEAHRLKVLDSGFCELGQAANVVVDDSGSVKVRYGTTSVFNAGPVHSLWSKGKYCFFVSGGNLYRRLLDGTNVLVISGIGDLPMYYEVMFGKVYMTNITVKLIVDDDSVTNWTFDSSAQQASDTRVLGMLSGFTKMCVHAGRMFVLVDNKYLWQSEPGNPRQFDISSGPIPFGEIYDFVSVGKGMYVSTDDGVLFLEGSAKENFIREVAYSKRAVTGTMQVMDGSDIGDDGQEFYGRTAVWVSSDGVCFGDARGFVKNKTSKQVIFDKAVSGTATVLPGQYLFSLEVE